MTSKLPLLVAVAFVGCHAASSSPSPSPLPSPSPSTSAPAPLPTLPLADFVVTFNEAWQVASRSYALEIKPDHSLTCTHGGASRTTKVADFELEPLEAIVRTPEFREAAKPSNFGVGEVPTYRIQVASKDVNLDANGYIYASSQYTTPAPMKSAIAELEKLCDLPTAKRVETYSVVYTSIEQGGTAGKVETYEVRSDGSTERRDPSGAIQKGKADAADLEPLSRLLARPELAALGRSFTDTPSTPAMRQQNYVVEISKTTKLSGRFYDKTPPIVLAITNETSRIATTAKPR